MDQKDQKMKPIFEALATLNGQIKKGFEQMNERIDQIANEIKLNDVYIDYDTVSNLNLICENVK